MAHKEFFQELKKDHREVKQILSKMKNQPAKQSEDLLGELKQELTPETRSNPP